MDIPGSSQNVNNPLNKYINIDSEDSKSENDSKQAPLLSPTVSLVLNKSQKNIPNILSRKKSMENINEFLKNDKERVKQLEQNRNPKNGPVIIKQMKQHNMKFREVPEDVTKHLIKTVISKQIVEKIFRRDPSKFPVFKITKLSNGTMTNLLPNQNFTPNILSKRKASELLNENKNLIKRSILVPVKTVKKNTVCSTHNSSNGISPTKGFRNILPKILPITIIKQKPTGLNDSQNKKIENVNIPPANQNILRNLLLTPSSQPKVYLGTEFSQKKIERKNNAVITKLKCKNLPHNIKTNNVSDSITSSIDLGTFSNEEDVYPSIKIEPFDSDEELTEKNDIESIEKNSNLIVLDDSSVSDSETKQKLNPIIKESNPPVIMCTKTGKFVGTTDDIKLSIITTYPSEENKTKSCDSYSINKVSDTDSPIIIPNNPNNINESQNESNLYLCSTTGLLYNKTNFKIINSEPDCVKKELEENLVMETEPEQSIIKDYISEKDIESSLPFIKQECDIPESDECDSQPAPEIEAVYLPTHEDMYMMHEDVSTDSLLPEENSISSYGQNNNKVEQQSTFNPSKVVIISVRGNVSDFDSTQVPGTSKDTTEKKNSLHDCSKELRVKKTIRKVKYTSVKNYECRYCKKNYMNEFLLSRHENQHLRKNTLKCSICKRYFYSQELMEQHVHEHNGTSCFKCNDCTMFFINEHDLLKHKKVHVNKPFTCQECRRGFVSMNNLIEHKKSHRPPRLYACSICKKIYNSSYRGQKHLSKMHSNDGHLTRVLPHPADN